MTSITGSGSVSETHRKNTDIATFAEVQKYFLDNVHSSQVFPLTVLKFSSSDSLLNSQERKIEDLRQCLSRYRKMQDPAALAQGNNVDCSLEAFLLQSILTSHELMHLESMSYRVHMHYSRSCSSFVY